MHGPSHSSVSDILISLNDTIKLFTLFLVNKCIYSHVIFSTLLLVVISLRCLFHYFPLTSSQEIVRSSTQHIAVTSCSTAMNQVALWSHKHGIFHLQQSFFRRGICPPLALACAPWICYFTCKSIIKALMTQQMVNCVCAKTVPDSTKLRLIKVQNQNFLGDHAPRPP